MYLNSTYVNFSNLVSLSYKLDTGCYIMCIKYKVVPYYVSLQFGPI